MINKKKVTKIACALLLCTAFIIADPISYLKNKETKADAASNAVTEVVDGVHIWTTYANYAVLQDPSSMKGDNMVPPTELTADSNLSLSVTMGKGEIEGTQLIMTPDRNVASYDITVSELKSGNNVISTAQIDIYNQAYISNEHPATQYKSIPSGWYPDILVPFDKAKEYGENKIEAGKNQGITIEFRTNSDTASGVYEGTFVMTIDGTKVNVPVQVTVRDIDLSTTHNMGATAASMGNITTETYEMLMDNYRICTQYAPGAAASPESMVEAVKKYWDNPHFTNYDIPNVSAANFKAYVKALAKASDSLEHNYLTKAICYIQDFDESQNYAGIIEYVQSLNAAKEDVKNELATYFEDEELETAVFKAIDNVMVYITANYWERQYLASEYKSLENNYSLCLIGYNIDTEASYLEYYKESTQKPWTYMNSGYPQTGATMNHYGYCMRYMGWKIAKEDLGGWLYWDMDLTSRMRGDDHSIEMYRPRDYYKDGLSFSGLDNRTDYSGSGDGQSLYPGKKWGEPDKLYPSQRITSFRDGVEDNEALYQLEQIYISLCKEYNVTGIDFDEMVAWIYNRGIADMGDYYVDDGAIVCEMRNIIFDLYDLAKSTEKLLCTGIHINKNEATLTFYSKASEVKCNDEVITGNNEKYTYTWSLNDKADIKITLDDETFQANVFDYGTLYQAMNSSKLNTGKGVSEYFTANDGNDANAKVQYVADKNMVKISIDKTTTEPALALPQFGINASLFDTDDLFDVYYISMTVRMKLKSEVGGTVPMKVMLVQDETSSAEENIFVWDPATADSDGWMERNITIEVSHEDLSSVSELKFQFEDFHLNWYHMGADIEISDIYYTKGQN